MAATEMKRGWMPAAAGAAAAVALGAALSAKPAAEMPRGVAGGDILDAFVGDARNALSVAMMHKADSYFHGGVDIEWMEETAEAEEHGKEDPEAEKNEAALEGFAHGSGDAGTRGHAEHIGSDEDGRTQFAKDAAARAKRDPWAWIDSKVHAQEHRHLDAGHSPELIPWYWAACRADPHNAAAYESAAYVIAAMMRNPEEAVRILDEGIRNNPDSALLEFDKGQTIDRYFRDAARAEPAFRAAVAKAERALAAAKGDDAEDAARIRRNAEAYLKAGR